MVIPFRVWARRTKSVERDWFPGCFRKASVILAVSAFLLMMGLYSKMIEPLVIKGNIKIGTNKVRISLIKEDQKMINEIGNAAGVLWKYLAENKETKLSRLKKELDFSADTLNRAIGWLAREEKIQLSKSGNSVLISLK